MENYINYVKGMNGRDEVIKWINTVLKNRAKSIQLNQVEVEHILDYLVSPKAPQRLLKMSYDEALSNTQKWVKAQQKKGRNIKELAGIDYKLFHEFEDGSAIVELLSQKSFQREGYLMSHCLGGYTPNSDVGIYSLRDSNGMPHATLEVRRNCGEIMQIKGKGNGSIHPKYIDKVLQFLSSLEIKIRPSEMVNLGYYHISSEIIEYAQKLKSDSDVFHTISGNTYVFRVG